MESTQTKPNPEAAANRAAPRGGEVEPTMEDILASIRRIIAEEDEPALNAKARATATDAKTGAEKPKRTAMTGRPAALESPALAKKSDLEARIDWSALDAMLDQAEREAGLTPTGSAAAVLRTTEGAETKATKPAESKNPEMKHAEVKAGDGRTAKVDPEILNRVKDAVLAESARRVSPKAAEAAKLEDVPLAERAGPVVTAPVSATPVVNAPVPSAAEPKAMPAASVVTSSDAPVFTAPPVSASSHAEPPPAPPVAEPAELVLDLSQAITLPNPVASAGPKLVSAPTSRVINTGPAPTVKDLVRRTVAASGQPVPQPEAPLREGDRLTPAKAEEAAARAFAEAIDPDSEAARRIYAQIRVTDDLDSESIEGLVRSILRPMLRDWLEENLPSLVERLVKAEIERISAHAARMARKRQGENEAS